MLQVLSGRFWNEAERFDISDEVVFYSTCNLKQEVAVPSGTLTPLNSDEIGIRRTRFSYIHGLPIPDGGMKPGMQVALSDEEIEAQMAALLTVYTEKFWSPDQKTVTDFVRENRKSSAFLPLLGAEREVDCASLTHFIDNAISLPRGKYKAVSTASLALQDAIQTSFISYDAAFSMVVFAIESLVPNTRPSWEDVPGNLTKPIDRILEGHEDIAYEIRSTLIKDRFFKLQANFVNFAKGHIGRGFYRLSDGVRKSDIDRLLRNAYSGRSKYAHALTAIKQPLFKEGRSQSVIWDMGEPQFTLQGVMTLACHIIRSYIEVGPHTKKEEGVSWYRDIPGVVSMQLDYEYWLWKPEVFLAPPSSILLCEVLQYATLLYLGVKKQLIDFRPGLEKSMSRAGQMKKEERLRLVCIVHIWERMASKLELHRADQFLQKYGDILESPSPEALILYVWKWFELPWTAEVAVKQWRIYVKQRYGIGKLRVMHSIEAAIQGAIANSFLSTSNIKEYENYCNYIADDNGHRPHVVKHVESSIKEKSPLSVSLLIGLSS